MFFSPKLNTPEKCFFLKKRVNCLGHTVREECIETDSTHTYKTKNYPRPPNSDELISCLALAGYYRTFVQNFSKVSRPLADVLPPTSLRKKGRKTTADQRLTLG